MKKVFCLVVILMSLSNSAHAGLFDSIVTYFSGKPQSVAGSPVAPNVVVMANDSAALGDNCLESLKNQVDKNLTNADQSINGIIKPGQKLSTMACLDRFKNFKVNGIFGLPDLSGLLSQLENKACQAIEQKVNQVVQPLNKQVNLGAGGIVTGNVYTTTYGTGINGKPIDVKTTTTSPSLFNIF